MPRPLFISSIILCVALFGLGIFFIIQAANSSTDRPLEDVANIHYDVPYCKTDNIRQTFDAYIPKTDIKPTVLIYIHGGGWKEGDKDNEIETEYAEVLANRGIASISIDYRLSNEATYPAQNQDVQCAIDYLRSGSHNLPIQTNQFVIMGDSAGGQLAAIEALDRKELYNGVIMAYGVSDLWTQIQDYKDNNAAGYLGTVNKELAEQASPDNETLEGSPDFLIIHGMEDTIVPASESLSFANKLRNSAVSVIYVPIKGASHAFLGSRDTSDEEAKGHILNFLTSRQ
jgi:acetyl esterase/lipase